MLLESDLLSIWIVELFIPSVENCIFQFSGIDVGCWKYYFECTVLYIASKYPSERNSTRMWCELYWKIKYIQITR